MGSESENSKKIKWRRQVEKSVKKVGLKNEEAADRIRWGEGVRTIAKGMKCIQPPFTTRKKTDETGRW